MHYSGESRWFLPRLFDSMDCMQPQQDLRGKNLPALMKTKYDDDDDSMISFEYVYLYLQYTVTMADASTDPR